MLNTFSKHEKYLNASALYIYAIVLNMPQFNNSWDIGEIIDIYFRKYVETNKHLSEKIMNDCRDIIELVENRNYINYIKSTFKSNKDAYHYLALTTQFYRIGNRYNLFTKNPYEMCNLENAFYAINMYIE